MITNIILENFLFLGRILNRFSKDTYFVDEELPWTFYDIVQVSKYFFILQLFNNYYISNNCILLCLLLFICLALQI